MLAESAGDGEISGAAASDVGTVSILASEARQVIHDAMCGLVVEVRNRLETPVSFSAQRYVVQLAQVTRSGLVLSIIGLITVGHRSLSPRGWHGHGPRRGPDHRDPKRTTCWIKECVFLQTCFRLSDNLMLGVATGWPWRRTSTEPKGPAARTKASRPRPPSASRDAWDADRTTGPTGTVTLGGIMSDPRSGARMVEPRVPAFRHGECQYLKSIDSCETAGATQVLSGRGSVERGP
jgi:hypothetical protein